MNGYEVIGRILVSWCMVGAVIYGVDYVEKAAKQRKQRQEKEREKLVQEVAELVADKLQPTAVAN